MEAEIAGKNESQCFKILTLSFLSDGMAIKETIRNWSGLNSAFIKILNDESKGYCFETANFGTSL